MDLKGLRNPRKKKYENPSARQDISKTAEPLPNGLSQRLFEVMQASEVLWKTPFPLHKMVFKCAADIVVKAVRHIDDYTEYTTLQYLEQYIPDCPAPRP
jgi:hypothetical protein